MELPGDVRLIIAHKAHLDWCQKWDVSIQNRPKMQAPPAAMLTIWEDDMTLIPYDSSRYEWLCARFRLRSIRNHNYQMEEHQQNFQIIHQYGDKHHKGLCSRFQRWVSKLFKGC